MTKDMVIKIGPRCKDLSGQRFGKLIVLRPVGRDKGGRILWLCRCDCGNETVVLGGHLRSGHTRSCGCLPGMLRHGACTNRHCTPEYQTWSGMRQRCQNPNSSGYQYYGGRGIKVCKRWQKFENFLIDMGKRPEGMTLDRIDNDSGYYQKNCRWATFHEQRCNSRPFSRGPHRQKWFLGFNTITGEFDEDNNQREFARRHGLTSDHISGCLRGERHQHKGWEFDYLPFQE